MSKVETQFTCPGCQTQTKQAFKKPSIINASVVKWECKSCESSVMALVSIDREKRNAVTVQARITKPGAGFMKMLQDKVESERKLAQEAAAKVEEFRTELGYTGYVAPNDEAETAQDQFLASTTEFPDLVIEASTREEAVSMLNRALDLKIVALQDAGLPIPAVPAQATVETSEQIIDLDAHPDLDLQVREYEAVAAVEQFHPDTSARVLAESRA